MGEEGLGLSEVGKEIAEHNRHAGGGAGGNAVTIIEAVLLAVVALLAAWSGFAAAKWSTESRLALAQSSTKRAEATQQYNAAQEARTFDASTFNAWFTGYVAGDTKAQELAARRFSPEYKAAFDAWLQTDPFTNPDAPKGPSYMPEYKQAAQVEGDVLSHEADEKYKEGADSGETADDYVRTTVLLASVLFLVGISSHFTLKGARYALVVLASAVLCYGLVLLILAPKPHT